MGKLRRSKLDLLRDVEKLIKKSKKPLNIGQIADKLETNWDSVKACCVYLEEKGLIGGQDKVIKISRVYK